MKIKSVTPILLLAVCVLFSMCKKDKDAPSTPGPNTGGIDTTGNGTNKPQLISFSPEKGAIGDTICITGINFTGTSNSLQVSFGNTSTKVITVNTANSNNVKNTVIKVLVPEMADITTKINLTIDTLILTSEKSFTRINVTEFSGFSPANGYIGDTITLTGAFYEKTPVVNFGDVAAKVISKDSKTLKVVVPDDITNSTVAINLAVDGQTMTSTTAFQLNAPVIETVSPTTVFSGQEIKITGKGFRGSHKYKQLLLDNALITTVTSLSNTLITCYIKNTGAGLHSIAVEVAGLKTQAKDQVQLIVPEVTAITPNTVTADDILIIKGHHLLAPAGMTPTYVTTTDNNGQLRVLSVQSITDDEIRVKTPTLSAGNYKITVNVALSSVEFGTPLTYYEKPI